MSGSTVIAEIGGSSSRWALLGPGDDVLLVADKGGNLPGFNPMSGDATLFIDAIRVELESHAPEFIKATKLFVYGAGCGSPVGRDLMRSTLARLWPIADIAVDTDLMAAARGLHANGAALVLILGTGMNAGWYDGSQLYQPMPSLGWVLGDEGSGADIGRILLQDAFYKRMPEVVSQALFGPAGPKLDHVLDAIYRQPFPARALAARTVLLKPLLEEPYVRELLVSRFHATAELLVTFFSAEQRATVHATGSVAWGFHEILAECLLDRGMSLMDVQRDPLPGLVRFHR